MKKISYLVCWFSSLLVAGLLVGCGGGSYQPSAVSDPHLDLLVAQAQLTGTAQAFEIQVVGWTATAQSWTATPSLTPVPTSTPTITFTPTVNVTGTIAVEKMNAEIKDIQLETERKILMNKVFAFSPYVIGLLFVFIMTMFGVVHVSRLAIKPTPMGENGIPQPMLNVIDGTWSTLDKSVNGTVALNKGFVAQLPAVTAERQDVVTNRAQMIDLQTRRGNLPRKLLESQTVVASASEVPALASSNESALFPLPSWNLLSSWNGEKNALPYGITMKGLGLVDVNQYSHLATIGMTGGGKSRRFFRPLIACALAAGHRVVVIGKTTDYFVFQGHPNVTTVKISQMTKPSHAEYYAAILKGLVQEMEKRDEYLSARHQSTWVNAGRERTFIVLDELGNALRLMPSHLSEAARIWVEGLVSEGRKVGFNIAVANQRATGMASILSQTGKAIFRVERDEEKAHKSLSGASDLREGYFYARFGDVQLAGAFEPTDAEIVQMLDARQTPPLESDWIDGQVLSSFDSELLQASTSPQIEEKADVISDEEANQVAQLLQEGLSPTNVIRKVFKVTGGSDFYKLNDVVKKIKDGLAEGAMA